MTELNTIMLTLLSDLLQLCIKPMRTGNNDNHRGRLTETINMCTHKHTHGVIMQCIMSFVSLYHIFFSCARSVLDMVP